MPFTLSFLLRVFVSSWHRFFWGVCMRFNSWDVALLIIIPAYATVMAYIFKPQAKAVFSIVPIPFTLATLSLGRPVDTTNAAGILLLVVFVHSVRILSSRAHVHILPSIVISSLGYCGIGSILAGVIPHTEKAFWLTIVPCFLLGILLFLLSPGIDEPGYRSPLPVPLKWIVITLVVFILIVIKKYLLGFMTVFPMVGVIAAYELRHSLWTYCRNIHVFVVAGSPMMMAIRLSQYQLGLGAALFVGWAVLLLIAVPVYFSLFNRQFRFCGLFFSDISRGKL